MSSKSATWPATRAIGADLARQIGNYENRVSELRARQHLVQENVGFFNDLYEEVSQGIEELRIVEEELRQRDGEIYQAYAAVVQERRRYRDLFALGPDAHLITDVSGVVLEANVRAEELLGYPAEYLCGKPIAAFFPGDAQRRLFREWFAGGVSSGEPETLDIAIKSHHKGQFAAELRVSRVTGDTPSSIHLLWAIVDVSQKLAAKCDAELAAVVRVSADAILVLSMDGTVLAQNPAFQRLYGDLMGQPVREVVLPESWEEHRRTIAGLSAAAPVATVDSIHLRSGGEPIDVSVTYSLIDEPAETPPRVALVIRDISARKPLESQLR